MLNDLPHLTKPGQCCSFTRAQNVWTMPRGLSSWYQGRGFEVQLSLYFNVTVLNRQLLLLGVAATGPYTISRIFCNSGLEHLGICRSRVNHFKFRVSMIFPYFISASKTSWWGQRLRRSSRYATLLRLPKKKYNSSKHARVRKQQDLLVNKWSYCVSCKIVDAYFCPHWDHNKYV